MLSSCQLPGYGLDGHAAREFDECMTKAREPIQMHEIQRSSLLCGPEWDAVVAAVCGDQQPDVDESVERLLAA